MSHTVRDVHNRQSALSRYRAERLLRKGFAELRSKVLASVRSKLRAVGVSLDYSDLEACYAQAWHGLYAAVLAGETVESPAGWLVLATFRRAIDEARSALRAQPGPGRDVASDDSRFPRAFEPDVAGALDDRAQLRAVFEALRARLSVREREAASLCYLQGLTRAQAAARMGIGERRMRKLMEGPGGGVPGVAAKVGELLDTVQTGGWCEQQGSLMRAYAFGILDPDGDRYALAVAHTRQCPACRARVATLRGLASVLPPLPLPPALASGLPGPARARPRLRPAARARHGLRAGGAPGGGVGALPLKLAVAGVALVGAVPAYLAVRSPAHGRVAGAAAVSAPAPAVVPVPVPASPRAAVKRARRVRKEHAPARASVERRALARSGTGPAAQAGEFSPERVRGQAGPAGAGARSHGRSSPAAGAAGEFGVE